MKYRESESKSRRFKKEYLEGIERLIEKREQSAESVRLERSKEIFEKQDEYRDSFCDMLGWPLNDKKYDCEVTAEKTLLSDEGEYSIYRMSFRFMDDICLTGLFFKHNDESVRPLVISQHGGGGTPEIASGIYGDSKYYTDMTMRLLKYGANVISPQLLLWEPRFYGAYHDRRDVDGRLKRTGSSVTALELFGLRKITDFFEREPYVGSIGMCGLSYGGFYTLYAAAIDKRIKGALSCSFFSERKKYVSSDWSWEGAAEKFDDAEIACLIYPRWLCIASGKGDTLFEYEYSKREFDRLRAL